MTAGVWRELAALGDWRMEWRDCASGGKEGGREKKDGAVANIGEEEVGTARAEKVEFDSLISKLLSSIARVLSGMPPGTY